MRMIGSLSKPLMDSRGPIGKVLTIATIAGGAGVAANVLDKELLKGKLKSMNVALPAQLTTMLKGASGTVTPTLNLTDLVTLLIGVGLSLKFNTKALFSTGGVLLLKKAAEARGWIIDDPLPGNSNTANNTAAQLEQMKQQLLAAQQQQSQISSNSGGLVGR